MPRRKPEQAAGVQPPPALETLLDIKTLMLHLGVSRPTVYTLMRDKGLPAVHLGAQLRFRPSSVARWVAAQEQAG